MNDEEIMKKFNEKLKGTQPEYSDTTYKAANNSNLNNSEINVANNLNSNITMSAPESTTNNMKIPDNQFPTNEFKNPRVLKADLPIPNETNTTYIQTKNNQNVDNTSYEGLDFTEQGLNVEDYPEVKYVEPKKKKKKNTIKITGEIRTAIVIVLILLVFIIFMPSIADFLRKLFLKFS